ncbi:MAG TPA: Holliday junction resolvase RecU, partial [Lachnospiraceae bacterium]|nr:Holliday junction resolvase RecU [Lachnospiraceae bacterium]
MSYWSGRGLRGSSFEELINMTNDIYFEKGLAVVQKVPTPITPMKMDKEKKVITLAYFEKKSTVDYIGAVQGIPMCFDAKETRQGRLPLQNIHEHQVKFMKKFDEQGGLAFLLV